MRFRALRAELPPLLALAVPLIFGELGWIAMSVVDTAMLGRAPNSALALASSALAQVLFNTLAFGVGGVLLALDTLISQALGEGDRRGANRWLWHGVVAAVILAAVLMLAVTALPALLWHLPVDGAVLQGAVPALRGLNYGVLPLLLYFALRRYLQAAHHGRLIMGALISANIINAVGDWLLIYGHHWMLFARPFAIPAFGVEGSAWATSMARLYLMLFLVAALVWADRKRGYDLRGTSPRLHVAHLRRMLALGAPVGAQICIEVAIFALATSVIATFGPVPLAGHEIALECASTTFMVPLAVSGATSVRVGHAIGRARVGLGELDRIAASGWSGILVGAGFMLSSALTFLLIPVPIARLFTTDATVVAAAAPLLLVAAGFQFFDGLQSTATGALRGTGRTLAPLLIQIVCFWIIGLPLGVLFAFKLHGRAVGVWWGLSTGLTLASLALLWQWHNLSRNPAALMESRDVAAPEAEPSL